VSCTLATQLASQVLHAWPHTVVTLATQSASQVPPPAPQQDGDIAQMLVTQRSQPATSAAPVVQRLCEQVPLLPVEQQFGWRLQILSTQTSSPPVSVRAEPGAHLSWPMPGGLFVTGRLQ
jgi:hypothetical protein